MYKFVLKLGIDLVSQVIFSIKPLLQLYIFEVVNMLCYCWNLSMEISDAKTVKLLCNFEIKNFTITFEVSMVMLAFSKWYLLTILILTMRKHSQLYFCVAGNRIINTNTRTRCQISSNMEVWYNYFYLSEICTCFFVCLFRCFPCKQRTNIIYKTLQ